MPDTDTHDLLAGPPQRWTSNRKVKAIWLVWDGHITRAAALQLWKISEQEWQSWLQRYNKHGPPGLQVTTLREYR